MLIPTKRKLIWLLLLASIIVISGIYIFFNTYYYKAKAKHIIDETGVEGGLIAHVGFKNPKLISALPINDRYIVHGISRNMKNISKTREYLLKKGLYGKVTVQQWRSKTLPYSDDLVNLLVVEKPDEVSKKEMIRVLSPEGVAYIHKDGDWEKLVKPYPDGIDKWTHYLHGPSNNPVANDSKIGPPRRLRWKSEPTWCRSHEYLSSFVVMVSDGKSVFYIFDDGLTGITGSEIPDKWTLYARNAYNGILLWERELKGWNSPEDNAYVTGRTAVPGMMQRTLVADDELVFTTIEYHGPITILDAVTGKTIRTIQGTNGTREILYSNGILYTFIDPEQKDKKPRIASIKPNTGEIIWEIKEEDYNSYSLAVSNGRIIYSADKELICLSAKDGRLLWRVDSENIDNYSWSWGPTIIIKGNAVIIRNGNVTELRELNNGKIMWVNKTPWKKGKGVLKKRLLRPGDLFVIDSLVWQSNTGEIAGYLIKNGNKVKSLRPDSIFSVGHHLRCYRAKATHKYIMPQFRGLEFVDLNGSFHCQNDWTRGSCMYGVLPSNGLVYVTPHPCFCYPGAMMKGLNAYSTASSQDIESEIRGYQNTPGRFVKGPAWPDKSKDIENYSSYSWPMYRHDHRRTNAIMTEVDANLLKSWELKIGGNLTPPVAGAGKAYVSSKDCNTIYAIDVQEGKILWNYSVGGQVDSPPTLYNGKVIFGSADGWVYCLSSKDGKLIWRFRAAPSPRMIVNKNRVESPWRVHGSPLLFDDKIYLTSGRSSFLDGGIFIYGLDPNTGKVIHKTRLNTWMKTRKDTKDKPFLPAFHIEGARSDVLVSEGGYIYLGQMKFTPDLEKLDPPYRKGLTEYKTLQRSYEQFGPIVKGDSVSKNLNYDFVHKETIKKYPKFSYRWLRRGHMGARHVGKHLLATGGLLDDSYFNRIYWMYSNTWPGYYIANVASKTGQLLVMGPEKTYGVNAFNERVFLSPQLTPGEKNYLLFADDNDNEPVLTEENWGRDKGMGFSRTEPPKWFHWIPVRIRAMVLAGGRLFIAGPPDIVDPEDPMAAFEGRKGALLWIYEAENGKQISKYSLDHPPVFDGMIAVKNRILISTTNGSLMCLKGIKVSTTQ